MTLWELMACIDGVSEANGAVSQVDPMSNDEFDDMLVRYDESRATQQ